MVVNNGHAASASSSTNVGLIAGVVVGAVVLLLLSALLAACLYRRRKQRQADLPAVQPSPSSSMLVNAVTKLKGIQLHRASTVDSSPSLVTQGSQLRLQQVDLAAVHHTSRLDAADDAPVGVEMVQLQGAAEAAGAGAEEAEADEDEHDYHVTSRPYFRTHVAIGATVSATLAASLTATLGGSSSTPQLGPVHDVSTTGSVTDFTPVDEAAFVGNPLALPAVWKQYRDGSGRKFYYNTVSGVSEWVLPMGATLQSNADM